MPIDVSQSGAVYHRVSEDDQDIDRQRAETRRWLERHETTVEKDHIYEDIGWKRREADRRPEFQRLMQDIEDGKVQWVVVDRPDRFGTKSKWQLVSYVYTLQEAGCRLYTCDDEELTGDDLVSFFKLGLEGEKSEKELYEKSIRIISAKVERARRGEWQGGIIPYAMDVACFPRDGDQELWRVKGEGHGLRVQIFPDGTTKRFDGDGNFPPTEANTILQLRPSADQEQHAVVQNIFGWYVHEEISPHKIAVRLNAMNHKPSYSIRWRRHNVVAILRNPIYVGRNAWNKCSMAAYSEFVGGTRRKVAKRTTVTVYRSVEDFVLSKVLFPPLVENDVWETAIAKLDGSRKSGGRKLRSEQHWLGEIVFCANCGKKMRCMTQPGGTLGYICMSYALARELNLDCTCHRNWIPQGVIENHLKTYLHEAGHALSEIGLPKAWIRPGREVMETTKAMTAAHAAMLRCLDINPEVPCGMDAEDLVDKYWEVYDRDQPLYEAMLAELERQHDLITSNLLRLPKTAELAFHKGQDELGRLEQQIAEIKRRLVDQGEAFLEAGQRVIDTMTNWEAAMMAVDQSSTFRQRALAISKVINRINISFEATGKRHPISRMKQIEFVPVGGDGDSETKNGGNGKCPNGNTFSRGDEPCCGSGA